MEGDKGNDVAPSDDRGTAVSDFRERVTFAPTGLVDNHEQLLYGLRYAKTAWRLSTGAQFHEELGYWMWDGTRKEVLISFTVPRGICVLAGGNTEADAGNFNVKATLGSSTFGIVSGPFLDEEFKTVGFEMSVTTIDVDRWSYEADTQLQIKGQDSIFHHTDANTLVRV